MKQNSRHSNYWLMDVIVVVSGVASIGIAGWGAMTGNGPGVSYSLAIGCFGACFIMAVGFRHCAERWRPVLELVWIVSAFTGLTAACVALLGGLWEVTLG